MSKYKIGQEIPVGGIITITGLARDKNGNPAYNTDRGVVVPELLIERLETKPLEKAQPEQPKQGPVTLYCVEDYSGFTTKGKTYKFTDGDIRLDDGNYTAGRFTDYVEFARYNKDIALCLVPLVSRPAKVGEWVYICNAIPVDRQTYKNGDVFKITHMHRTYSHNVCNDQQEDWFEDEEYLVLDGYKPEPEYYSGKVVCAEATDTGVTVGKAYSVENGIFTWDNGTRFATKVSTIEQLNNWFVGAKFVEFKGE